MYYPGGHGIPGKVQERRLQREDRSREPQHREQYPQGVGRPPAFVAYQPEIAEKQERRHQEHYGRQQDHHPHAHVVNDEQVPRKSPHRVVVHLVHCYQQKHRRENADASVCHHAVGELALYPAVQKRPQHHDYRKGQNKQQAVDEDLKPAEIDACGAVHDDAQQPHAEARRDVPVHDRAVRVLHAVVYIDVCMAPFQTAENKDRLVLFVGGFHQLHYAFLRIAKLRALHLGAGVELVCMAAVIPAAQNSPRYGDYYGQRHADVQYGQFYVPGLFLFIHAEIISSVLLFLKMPGPF